MQIRTEIVNGKQRIIIVKQASGIDKTQEAVLRVMGPGWKFDEDDEKKEKVI